MDEVKMLVSCVVEKEGRKIVRVSFLRGMEEERSMDYAEGILPDGIIVKSEGFSGTEVQKLEAYMRANRKDILKQAGEVDPFRKWLEG